MFGWNRPITGREGMAAELFMHTVNFFEKLKRANSLESFEPIFLVDHGGDLGGYFLLKGTHDQLDTLKSNDEWVEIVMRAGHSLTGVGIIDCFTGTTVPELMARWTKTIPSH
ncbi:MAG: hypothetical protein H0T42_16435 [Deltaproteobacteria bacterium]|nr:hypothetical protein [Deltaproteobacteria bacterium]